LILFATDGTDETGGAGGAVGRTPNLERATPNADMAAAKDPRGGKGRRRDCIQEMVTETRRYLRDPLRQTGLSRIMT